MLSERYGKLFLSLPGKEPRFLSRSSRSLVTNTLWAIYTHVQTYSKWRIIVISLANFIRDSYQIIRYHASGKCQEHAAFIFRVEIDGGKKLFRTVATFLQYHTAAPSYSASRDPLSHTVAQLNQLYWDRPVSCRHKKRMHSFLRKIFSK
jgi:hypothetical protein